MFSRRLDWHVRQNRLTERASIRRESGLELLDLTNSNPTAVGLIHSPEILEAFDAQETLRYEPVAAGLLSAREAIAAQMGAAADSLILTASTSEAYSWLFKLLCDEGDEVLTPAPSYPLFEFLAALEGVTLNRYPLYYAGCWHMDTDAIASLITARTRAIVIVNPNNPTGSYLKSGELDRLISLCGEHDLALISDEVFSLFPIRDEEDRVPTIVDVDAVNVFVLNGLSKLAALPQMKLGWIAVNGPRSGESMRNLELIADSFLSVGAPVQHAAPRLLEAAPSMRRRILGRVLENLQTLRAAVENTPCQLLDLEGGWCATLRIPGTRSDEEWTLALIDKEGVLVQPGYFFDFSGETCIVISLITPPDTFRKGLAHIVRTIQSH